MKPALNIRRPYLSEEDRKEDKAKWNAIYGAKRYKDNREEIIEKSKKYNKEHKEEIKVNKAIYYLDNIEEKKNIQHKLL